MLFKTRFIYSPFSKKQFELQHLLQEGKIDRNAVNEDLAEKLSQLDAVIQKEMMQALADISPKGK